MKVLIVAVAVFCLLIVRGEQALENENECKSVQSCNGTSKSPMVIQNEEEVNYQDELHEYNTEPLVPVWQEVCVSGSAVSDNDNCSCALPCKSLDMALEHVTNHTLIRIIDYTYVDNPLNITSPLTGLTISGYSDSKPSNIKCNYHYAAHAGLQFNNAANLTFENLRIHSCTMYITGFGSTSSLLAAVYILNSRDVAFHNVDISYSSGISLLLINTYGEVVINRSNFTHNYGKNTSGGGISIEFYTCPSDKPTLSMLSSSYHIDGCIISDNFAEPYNYDEIVSGEHKAGGGLSLLFGGNACANVINISNCTFSHNNARFGGGAAVSFEYNSAYNNVTIDDCNFIENDAKAGGSLDMGYINYTSPPPLDNNRITIENSTFINSTAVFGAGTAIYSTHSNKPSSPGDTIVFKNCTWVGNIANFGPAVDISPYIREAKTFGNLPIPLFVNCSFYSNAIQNKIKSMTRTIHYGAFTVTLFYVQFSGKTIFYNNSNTALYLSSATAVFAPGSKVLFEANSGINGGAVAIIGFSALVVNDNSSLDFVNNTASSDGGAINYYSYDQHDFVGSDRCFIQYNGDNKYVKYRNIKFNCSGNKASDSGNCIYATSFYPCYFSCEAYLHTLNLTSFLNECIGHFFYNESDEDSFGTQGYLFTHGNDTQYVTPGNITQLNFTLVNELNYSVSAVYRVQVNDPHSVIIDPDYEFTSIKYTKLTGLPGTRSYLTFDTYDSFARTVELTIPVVLQHCSPGYYLNKSSCTCECSAYGNLTTQYPGIPRCDSYEMQAYIIQGYWAGYVHFEVQNATTCIPQSDNDDCYLYTAMCSMSFCWYVKNTSQPSFHQYKLPGEPENLESFMCGNSRLGPLCGMCAENHSVHFHSREFNCDNNANCQLGFLFYTISELLPLTLLFLILLTFNINLTSGALNGFIFFAQIFSFLDVTLHGAIKYSHKLQIFSDGYKILYGFFNLEFFTVESLSFCLWEGAGVLDILAFKYVTTAFALALVFLLVTVLRYCYCQYNCCGVMNNTKHSMLHGLTAYFVMCYAQYTQITFQLLSPQYLLGKDGVPASITLTNGGVPYFGHEHIKYAIPACLVLVTFVLLPPTLLLVYPLHYKLLALCGLAESRRISDYFPFRKLRPFLDSFQGCFKDKYRFFAGLYFVYRLLPPALQFSVVHSLQFYILMELLLITMILIHATVQPYSKKWHNVLDACLFANLAVINGFTLYIYAYEYYIFEAKWIKVVSWFQATLACFPLLYVCTYMTVKIILALKHLRQDQRDIAITDRVETSQYNYPENGHNADDDNDDELLAILEEDRSIYRNYDATSASSEPQRNVV